MPESSDDCGPFAVAYAATNCYGKRPEKYMHFPPGLDKTSFAKCLHGRISKNAEILINLSTRVHCSCGTPRTRDEDN